MFVQDSYRTVGRRSDSAIGSGRSRTEDTEDTEAFKVWTNLGSGERLEAIGILA